MLLETFVSSVQEKRVNLGFPNFSGISRYAPGAELFSPLSKFESHNLLTHYRLLSSYYVKQRNDASCSLASTAMIVNAARFQKFATADVGVVTQEEVLKQVGSDLWINNTTPIGEGVTLAEFAVLLKSALHAYGFTESDVARETVFDTSEKSIAEICAALSALQQSVNEFIVLNFLYDDGKHAPVGHFALAAAYDLQRDAVLIIDPDQETLAPYWISVEMLMKSLATTDPQSQSYRGYLRVRV